MSALPGSVLLVALDAETRDHAGAEHLAHRAVGVLGGRVDLVSSHVVRPAGLGPHTAVVLRRTTTGRAPLTALAEELGSALGAGVVLATGEEGPAASYGGAGRVAGAHEALDAHLSQRSGRLVVYPGQGEVESLTTAAAIVACSCVDAVEGLAGVVVEPGTVVDLTGFARPTWHDGRCVVLVQPAVTGLVAFEQRVQIPCCADH